MPKFDLFRYQILPIDRNDIGSLFEPKSLDELLESKNSEFWTALKIPRVFHHKQGMTHQFVAQDRDSALIRIGVNRPLLREAKDFTSEMVDSWPSFLVFIWNDPEVQVIAVQKRVEAFQDSAAVVKSIRTTLNPFLAPKNLRVHTEPIYEVDEFWTLVEQYRNKIRAITFELVTPNMANISGQLSEDVKAFAKDTNAAMTKLTLVADPDSVLKVEQSDPGISGMADYAADGGGKVSFKVVGLKKQVTTSGASKDISVDEVQLSGDAATVLAILKQLIPK